jgi:hypothetical protein
MNQGVWLVIIKPKAFLNLRTNLPSLFASTFLTPPTRPELDALLHG